MLARNTRSCIRQCIRMYTTRQPPTVLGVREAPIIDRSGWFERKKQKLRDLTDYEKAFAAHAAERRHL